MINDPRIKLWCGDLNEMGCDVEVFLTAKRERRKRNSKNVKGANLSIESWSKNDPI